VLARYTDVKVLSTYMEHASQLVITRAGRDAIIGSDGRFRAGRTQDERQRPRSPGARY